MVTLVSYDEWLWWPLLLNNFDEMLWHCESMFEIIMVTLVNSIIQVKNCSDGRFFFESRGASNMGHCHGYSGQHN